MSKISDNYTHVSNLTGKYRLGTTDPINTGPAGLKTGDLYVNTSTNTLNIYNGSTWTRRTLTTTSTSTS